MRVKVRAARCKGEALKSNFRPEMYESERNGCHQRDALKTVPRTVFLTGFRIPCSKNAKKEQVRKNIRTCSLARCKGEALKSNFRPEMYESERNGCHQRDALKTVPRTVFLTGFRIPCSKNAKKEQVRKNIRTCSLARCKGFEPLTFWFVVLD